MTRFKQLSAIALASISVSTMAADFSFERPGTGFGTGITPVGKLAWEQALPSATYTETTINGSKQRDVTLNADMQLRTGLGQNTELQLGWAGPAWSKNKYQGHSVEDDGLGDVTVGIKHHVDLQDEKLSLAILAQALIATGNKGFSQEEDIYTLASAVDYKYNDLVTTSLSMFYEVQDSDWSITAVPTVGYKIAGNLSGYSELVYRKKESVDNEYALGTGLIYAVNDRAQFDVGVGVDLDGQDRSYNAGFGVSYLF